MDRPLIDPLQTTNGVPRTRGDGPRPHSTAGARKRVPRTRGDGPPPAPEQPQAHGCSPHTRGWTADHGTKGKLIARVPRTRGDGPLLNLGLLFLVLVFPAHAGMDRSPRQWWWTCLRCSPHTRGWTEEAPVCQPDAGSVPRTRGDGPVSSLEDTVAAHVFPAHAGMDRAAGQGYDG